MRARQFARSAFQIQRCKRSTTDDNRRLAPCGHLPTGHGRGSRPTLDDTKSPPVKLLRAGVAHASGDPRPLQLAGRPATSDRWPQIGQLSCVVRSRVFGPKARKSCALELGGLNSMPPLLCHHGDVTFFPIEPTRSGESRKTLATLARHERPMHDARRGRGNFATTTTSERNLSVNQVRSLRPSNCWKK